MKFSVIDTIGLMIFSNPQFLRSTWRSAEVPDGVPLVVFAGRSNAGKSSAINALCGGRFARVSRDPGRTRMINLFQLAGGAVLADLPGYGYAKISRTEQASWAAPMERFLRSPKICGMVIIVDCRRGLGELDLLLLAGFAARPVLVILSKADKINREKSILAQREAEKTMSELSPAAVVLPFSATKKTGLAKARAVLSGWVSRD